MSLSKCKLCGKTFEYFNKKGYRPVYCSRICKNIAWKGNTAPHWRGGKKEKICLNCGKPFKVFPSYGHHKFCSKDCWYYYKDKPKRNRYPIIKSKSDRITLRREEILSEILSGVSEEVHNNLLKEYNSL